MGYIPNIADMSLKLHGSPYSTCTQRVLIAAAEAGVEVELVVIDFAKGEHKSQKFLQLQPFGKVPVLEDTETGVTLYESRAIARYIATKAKASPLVPLASDPDYLAKLAKFETATSVEYSNFDPQASGLAFECIFKKMKGLGEADPARVEALAKQLATYLDGYEQILSKSTYMAGEDFTLVDIFHIPYGAKLFAIGKGDLITSRPHVAKWWKAITEREAVKKVIQS